MKTAILLGASGLTGGHVLEKLLKDENYGIVKLFNRTASGKTHPKIQEIICDMLDLETQSENFKGDVVFFFYRNHQQKHARPKIVSPN
jgi:nucleoside-diphosphate-sugar epimerase